jgi:hypothetical protein
MVNRLVSAERSRARGGRLTHGVLVLIPVTAILGGTVVTTSQARDARGSGGPRGHVARTLTSGEQAHLHVVASGSAQIAEEGTATGALPGKIRAYITVGPTITASFTLYPNGGGSISGKGWGTPKGRAEEPSFAGTMTIVHGTGRYARARGHGGFYGVLKRSNDALTVQTTGTISY